MAENTAGYHELLQTRHLVLIKMIQARRQVEVLQESLAIMQPQHCQASRHSIQASLQRQIVFLKSIINMYSDYSDVQTLHYEHLTRQIMIGFWGSIPASRSQVLSSVRMDGVGSSSDSDEAGTNLMQSRPGSTDLIDSNDETNNKSNDSDADMDCTGESDKEAPESDQSYSCDAEVAEMDHDYGLINVSD